MSRHASAEDLASLDLDALKPRKAARIRAHVATCAQCTQLSSEVSAVPTTLASVSYPLMPASVSSQLDAALASESSQRLATAPATEAGRRDLPERRRPPRDRDAWRMPGLPVFASRLVAAAGALAVVGVGGYEIATHAGGTAVQTSASSAGSAGVPSARELHMGPNVTFGDSAHRTTVQTVNSPTNFTRAELGTQAIAALHAAELRGLSPTAPTAGASAATGSANAKSSATGGAGQAASQGGLASCLDGIVGAKPVRLVESAYFQGKPATIIITAATPGIPAEVWVAGPSCTATHPDVLDHLTLSQS
jgi:hypothetical protein